jgi:hypothetical protein
MPIRTRSGPVSPHGSPINPRCATRLAVAASIATGKTAIIPSPVVLTTVPPEPSMALRRMTS